MFTVISSPIRWAGSKKILLNEMLEMFDQEKKNYIEPFLGSGIVLLNVLNNNIYNDYYVNDYNKDLIGFYIELQKKPKDLIDRIKKYVIDYNQFDKIEDKSEFYYECRLKYNNSMTENKEKVVLFWFLMKTGYNGVYRINSKGKFNVPFGKKTKITLDEIKMLNLSYLIQNVHFYSMDYLEFLSILKKKGLLNEAFIYCDPPYVPETKSTEKHVIYSNIMFNHEKFILDIKKIIIEEDVSVMISMSESRKSREIFNNKNLYKYDINDILRKVNPINKVKSKEIVFTNYEI